MVDPKGKLYTVPAESIAKAVAAGWSHATPEAVQRERQIQAGVREAEGSRIETGANRFANELLLGAPELEKQYRQSAEENAIDKEVKERVEAKHPVEALAEKALGFIAPMLASGGLSAVGEAGVKGATEVAGRELAEKAVAAAAEKSLARKIGTAAARAAGEGAVYSTPTAAVQAAYGDPESAAETMLWGIGLGGVLGGAGKIAGAGVKAGVKVGGGAVGRAAEKLAPKAEEFLDAHYGKLDSALEQDAYRKLGPKAQDALTTLRAQTTEKMPELANELHGAAREHLAAIEDRLAQVGEDGKFSGLREARKDIRALAEGHAEDSVQRNLSELASNVIDNHMDSAAGNLYKEGALRKEYPSLLSAKAAMLAMVSPKAAVVGAASDAAKTWALNQVMANRGGLLQKGIGHLREFVDNPEFAGLLAKEGSAALEQHLDKLGTILSGSTIAGRSAAAENPAQHLLGESLTGLTKQQQYDRLTNTVRRAMVDVASTADAAGTIAGPFASQDPALAQQLIIKKLTALSYLAESIPKAPAPLPFQPTGEWQPSKQQQQDFLRKAAVVNDPMVVWHNYQTGSLTRTDRDALMATYPAIYRQMSERILAAAYDPTGPKPTYEQRLQLSMFTGVPLDASIKNSPQIQAALNMGASQQQPPQSQGGRPKPSSRPNFQRSKGQYQTESQRLEYGRDGG